MQKEETIKHPSAPKRKMSERDSLASHAPADAVVDAAGEIGTKRRRVETADNDDGDMTSLSPRRAKSNFPTHPSEDTIAEWDCIDLSLVRRWLGRTRRRFERARCDAAWWDRAVCALEPRPKQAGSGLLLVSAILCGRRFDTSYEDLVEGVPDGVLGAVAWRASRLIFGLCIHPDGCGPVASRPDGTPAHPHADRVLRLALTLPPDHEERDADDNLIFTVGQVVRTIADLCGGAMSGRRLARFMRLLAKWHASACVHWGETRESIECFIERRILLTERTGCTAADLVAGRLRPCDWLAGAPGPTTRAPARSTKHCRDTGKDKGNAKNSSGSESDNGDDDGRSGVDILYNVAPNQVHKHGDDDGTLSRNEGTAGALKIYDVTGAVEESAVVVQPSDHDRAIAEFESDKRDALQRRRESPSLRCIYDRVVCKQPAASGRLSCLYIQSQLCAAEDRPNA